MPTYDYICLACKKRFAKFLTYEEYDRTKVICPHCGSEDVTRRIGKIRVARSSANRLADMADPAALNAIEDDPARWEK
jgi:putative FmdB family regulatory protein